MLCLFITFRFEANILNLNVAHEGFHCLGPAYSSSLISVFPLTLCSCLVHWLCYCFCSLFDSPQSLLFQTFSLASQSARNVLPPFPTSSCCINIY